MGRYSRDPQAIARDLCIAFAHPRYADVRPVNALADLKGHGPVAPPREATTADTRRERAEA